MKPYKIVYWTSSINKQVYVFTLDPNYIPLKNEKIIKEIINDDDNINILLKKLCVYLKTSPDDIYLWINKNVHKTNNLILNFINNCFKNDKRITYDYFKQCINNYFSETLKELSYTTIDKELAYRILNEHCILTNVIEPIKFKYIDNGYFQYISYNPFSAIKQLEEDITQYQVISYFAITLASFDITDRTINMILKDKKLPYLFPINDTKFSIKETTDFIKKLSEVENIVVNTTETIEKEKQFKTNYYISYLSAKVNDINFNPTVDLAYLFDKVHTTDNIPYIKYRTPTNIIYKFNKNLLTTLPEEDLEKIKRNKQQSKIETSFILFKMQFTSESYCSFFISDTMVYHIKFNLKKKEKISLDKIEKFYDNLNEIIKEAKKLYSNIEMPLVTPDNITIIEMSTNNIINYENKSIKYDKFETIIKQVLYPYFNILTMGEENVLYLQYKKVDHYIKYDNIQAYITRNYKKEKEEIILSLMNEFLISNNEAENEYEKWVNMNDIEIIMKDDKKIIKPKSEIFINLKIRLLSKIDLDCIITGLKSLDMQERLLNLLNVLVYLSNNGNIKKTASKEIDIDKDVYPKPVAVFGELEDIELDPEFMELGMEITKEEEVTKAIRPNKSKGLVLERLLEYDRDLFHYERPKGEMKKDYATVCTGRQPIVLTKEEKAKIDKEFPTSYDGYLKIGSTPELAKKHYYICPAIWCPVSKVSMSNEDFKKNKGCPKGEEPILNINKSYWGLGEEGLNRKRFPSVLDVNIHPKGICIPCCFKLDNNKDGTRNKMRLKACLDKTPDLIQTNAKKAESIVVTSTAENVTGNPKYILNDDKLPLEPLRYGLVSMKLGSVLDNKRGNTGLLGPDTNCYLRKGVDNKESSFIASIISILDNPEIKTLKDFINILLTKLTIIKFIQIENGKLLKLFINKDYDIQSNFKEFIKWFVKQEKYIRRFNLQKILNEISNVSVFTTSLINYKEILREFMIYNAYIHYIEFIKNNDIIKDHRVLIDLVNIEYEFINIHRYNIVLIEEYVNKLNVLCPFNRDTKDFINPNNPFVFIIQNGKYYEPLHYVIGGNLRESQYTFKINNALPEIYNIIKYFYNNCSLITNEYISGEDICLHLELNGYKIKYYVLDYSFRIRGVLLKNNLYVPFINKVDLFNIRKNKYVYYNDIIRFKCIEDLDKIKEIFKKLEEKSKFYKIKTINEKYIQLNKETIPLNASPSAIDYRIFNDDLDIFILNDYREKIKDKETIWTYINKDDESKKEIEFLISEKNPLPKDFKRKKLVDIFNKLKAPPSMSYKIIERLLLRHNIYFSYKLDKYNIKENEILLDHHDILNKRLDEAIEYQKNPFKFLMERLDENIDPYKFEEITTYEKIFPSEFMNEANELLDVKTKFKDTLTKFGFKKISAEGVYDINYIYDFFVAVNLYLNPRRKLTIEMIKSLIKNRIINDYNSNNLSEFYNNPAFQFLMNKKNTKTPELSLVLETFDSIYYYPNDYEIIILSELLQVNIVILARQGKKIVEGVKRPYDGIDIFKNDSGYYILLEKNHIDNDNGKKTSYNQFEIIINKTKFVFIENDMKKFYNNIIKNKLGLIEINVSSSQSDSNSSSSK